MKKFLGIALTLALLLPVLAGCQSAASTVQHNASPAAPANGNAIQKQVSASAETTAPATRLTSEDALDIALNDAGLTKDQLRDLDIELDRDDGTLHYNVDFEADGYDYEYEIHAESGKIIKSRKERD